MVSVEISHPQWLQASAMCSMTTSGVCFTCKVFPLCPGCPPGLRPVFTRRLLGLINGLLEGGLLLLVLFAFKRARSCTFYTLSRSFSWRISSKYVCSFLEHLRISSIISGKGCTAEHLPKIPA